MDPEFMEQLAAKLQMAAKKPNVLNYNANSPIHADFHQSKKVGRILRGGNRSGKSTAGVVEDIWRATGRHPLQVTHDIPIRGRIVTVDKDTGIDLIIKPLLAQWTPPSELVNGSWEDSWKNRGSMMTFRNGSTIDVKTHQQETEAFAGVPLHFVHFDEECPQAIFNECRLRLVDFNGVWYMTMTPVLGQDWIFDRFISTNSKNVAMFEVNIADNPHLNTEALVLLEEDLEETEKKIRQQGLFVPRGGLVLREFDIKRHVIEGQGQVPKSWPIYVSIDHGYNNPTAVLWHAVSPKGEVVTFKEHYQSKWVIEQHVVRINEINQEYDIKPTLYVGDPSMAQRNAITGTSALAEYRRHGIPLMQGKKDVAGRINKMNEYLKHDKWHITEKCPNTIKEARGYSFMIFNSPKIADRNNVREVPRPKNDHAMDSSGYFFNLMPYLTPEDKTLGRGMSRTITNMEDFPWQIDGSFIRAEEQDFLMGEV